MPKSSTIAGYSRSPAPRKSLRAASAVPPERSITDAPTRADDRAKASPVPSRHQTDQERIDRATELKRQGLSNKRIAAILGCGEKTIGGIVRGVQPDLRMPQADSTSETDPRRPRAELLGNYFDALYHNARLRSVTFMYCADGHFDQGGPPASRFLCIAEQQLQDRLTKLSPHTLRRLAEDPLLQADFLRDVVGELYTDYLWWHRDPETIGSSVNGSAGEAWRPPWERPKTDRAPYLDVFGLDI